jgi:ligand-binding SRPBCC domain-containing protein
VPVDVSTEIVIARPRDQVAAYAADPDNAMAWYGNIETVVWETRPPVVLGSRIAFEARFLGRTLAYTYVVREHDPGERFVMATEDGPFPMETTYTWTDAGPDATRMTLRNQGEPSGFSRVATPLVSRAMRRENARDLERLKGLLEGSGGAATRDGG